MLFLLNKLFKESSKSNHASKYQISILKYKSLKSTIPIPKPKHRKKKQTKSDLECYKKIQKMHSNWRTGGTPKNITELPEDCPLEGSNMKTMTRNFNLFQTILPNKSSHKRGTSIQSSIKIKNSEIESLNSKLQNELQIPFPERNSISALRSSIPSTSVNFSRDLSAQSKLRRMEESM